MYTYTCEKCGREQGEEQREFTWKPEFVTVCEDCYCELVREEKQYE